MNILVIKTSALGDVVRTTPILRKLKGNIFWVTSEKAKELLPKDKLKAILILKNLEEISKIYFDLILSLEEDLQLANFVNNLSYKKLIGVYFDRKLKKILYTKESSLWFDMSLISRFGKKKADELKWKNRKSYQEILFKMLGFKFEGDEYLLNYEVQKPTYKKIKKVFIEKRAGDKWPMKRWPFYYVVEKRLKKLKFSVRYLTQRKTLTDYLKDVSKCDVLICGDTLAMHLGLYLKKKVIAIFNCTSPWEIYDYGRMVKVVNPKLKDAFYKKDYDRKLVSAIKPNEVLNAFYKFLDE
jgi:heptosyltransferase-2